ncbi:hypothetical protein PR001_g18483 [Phytophthora rubi]|uniref:Uncharacterized protein n=1 Tax=Phytophthora rubi TaxID=129364 RepID=A0A6A3K7L3_9STRA|nr:hypothetical protein PR001_g18483 [Phytophthora rubi]
MPASARSSAGVGGAAPSASAAATEADSGFWGCIRCIGRRSSTKVRRCIGS